MNHRIDSIENINRVLGQSSKPGSSDFDLNPGGRPFQPPKNWLREAAVLVPLIGAKTDLRVILTKRASHLKHHPGQIAFPGGKVEKTDRDHTAAALREAQEEIGLSPRDVKVLGHIPFHETVTHFRITPVVGLVGGSFIPVPEIGEVEEVFEVPLVYLADPNNYQIEGRIWGGVRRQYFTIPYGPYYIWGATARILQGFAERLSK
ncbi:MAG: CoA pyrophosphatase [Alphaproteobacteria bacterium]|nr:CoA pyrophosphatase [Alphaproteobacteria bacterium]